ncbi:MAG: hypothetical protein K0R39_5130 [Symbiobacteriaceae bacterium]|jgi:hypothetical protein|nr:hypothetical protein [Symbiobacteriaceae bacterium]
MAQPKKPDDPQNQPEKFIIPMAQDPAKAAAEAAAQAAEEAARQASGQAQPPDIKNHVPNNSGRTLRINTNSSDRVIRRNHQTAFVWLNSPGTLILGIASKWKYEDNAKVRKAELTNGKIEKIRCARYDDEMVIHSWVTDSLDPDGIPVTETKGGLQANIAPWLFKEGIAPDPGINQKFDLNDSPELMLGLPALCFNMTKAKKVTRVDPSEKKAAEGEASTKDTKKRKQDVPAADDENE